MITLRFLDATPDEIARRFMVGPMYYRWIGETRVDVLLDDEIFEVYCEPTGVESLSLLLVADGCTVYKIWSGAVDADICGRRFVVGEA